MGSEEFCAVVLKETGKVIGNIYCGKRDYDAKEVGYIINKDYQRCGYAAEALSAVIRKAFRQGALGFTPSVIHGMKAPGNFLKRQGCGGKHICRRICFFIGMIRETQSGRIPTCMRF